APASQTELELDFGERIVRGMMAAHLLGAPLAAGGLAIERVADTIEDRSLSCPRRAVDQKERIRRQAREVDLLALGKGAEGAQDQADRSHGATSRSCWDRAEISACSRRLADSSSARPVISR